LCHEKDPSMLFFHETTGSVLNPEDLFTKL